MKRMKKIVSMLLAVIMVLGMSLTVIAADNNPHKITVTQNSDDKTEHTYEAYQIFAGDLATVDGKLVLSNIVWGSNENQEGIFASLKAEPTLNGVLADCETESKVAEVLSTSKNGDNKLFESSDISASTLTDTFARLVENNLKGEPVATAKGTGNVEISVTGSGYYLVKDKDDSVNTANGAYSRFMLEVVGDATVNVKSEVPTGDKKVFVDETTTGDANNASIGSHVSYEITSEVPNHVGYNYYYFIMNDTLSDGLTFDGAGSVAVKVGNTTLRQGTDYYVYTGTDVAPKTFRLAFNDIMQYTVGDAIVVTYSATVNDQAKVGVEGNPNTWTLQYSNNPDDTFDGDRLDDEDKPGLPADEENEALGETPEEKTLTYVTGLDIIKYANKMEENDLTQNLLAGAEFTLTGTSKQVVLKNVEYYALPGEGETGTWYKLKDGTYTESAPETTEYVKVGVGTATTTKGYLKNADGGYYVPGNAAEYNGKDIYKLVNGNIANYDDPWTKYVKKTVTEKAVEEVPVNISIEKMTGENGKISFVGLGEGTYTLKETVTPAGFNTLNPITIEIKFEGPKNDKGEVEVTTGQEKCTWTMKWTQDGVTKEYSSKVGAVKEDGTSVDGIFESGVFAQNVINQSGSLLPSTGGIGTTIFYVVGGILVIGAGILLVAKKRMSAGK